MSIAAKSEQLRCQVAGIIETAQLPKTNINRKERQALAELRKEKSIMTLPEDKGKATVVMNIVEYLQKVITILTDNKMHAKLKKDPRQKYKRQLVSIIRILKEDGKMTEELHKYLHPTARNVPMIHCTNNNQ